MQPEKGPPQCVPPCLPLIPTLCGASCQWPAQDFQQRADSHARFSGPSLCVCLWRIPDGWPDLRAVIIPSVASSFPGMGGKEGGRGSSMRNLQAHQGRRGPATDAAPMWAIGCSLALHPLPGSGLVLPVPGPPSCLLSPAKPTVGLSPPACLSPEWDRSVPSQRQQLSSFPLSSPCPQASLFAVFVEPTTITL